MALGSDTVGVWLAAAGELSFTVGEGDEVSAPGPWEVLRGMVGAGAGVLPPGPWDVFRGMVGAGAGALPPEP